MTTLHNQQNAILSAHNPALADLEFLSGEWDMELSNAPFLPSRADTARGRVTFEWIEDGAILVMRQSGPSGDPPSARWAIGRDESNQDYNVLYSDLRGVSRVYEMSLRKGTWKLWRNSPGFSQRFEGRVSGGQNTITSHWEKSADGAVWEHDFDITYTRRVSLMDASGNIGAQ